MKYAFVVVLVLVLSSIGCAPRPRIISSLRADLDSDGTIETVTITYVTLEDGQPVGGDVLVYQKGDEPTWTQSLINPWKLQIGDVDGDGPKEVIVGAWKSTPKDPVTAKRLFVYWWDGKRLLPKWLGSRLGRRFVDFAVADVNADCWDEVIALEVAPRGRHRVSVYRWLSFGFEWLGASTEMPGLTAVETRNGAVFVETARGPARISFAKGAVRLQTGGKTK